MKVESINGIIPHVQLRTFDHRGYFSTLYPNGHLFDVRQIAQSKSKKGVLRGLHFQIGMAKTMRVIHGAITLVSVDLRRGSPTFLDHTVELLEDSAQFHTAGSWCARGFVALTDDTIVEYFHSDTFKPKEAYTIAWNDPTLGIDWNPGNLIDEPFLLSQKDEHDGWSVDKWLTTPASRFPEFHNAPYLTISL